MTEYRILEVTPISAEGLKNVKLFGKMQTYVVAWVDPSRKASTNLDKLGGKDPRWNEKLSLAVDERLLQQGNAYLMLEIYSSGSMGSSIVGRVSVPLREISSKASGDAPISYQVKRPSGRVQGVLHMSVKLGEKISQPAGAPYPPAQGTPEPAMAYPAGSGGGYPPGQQGYGYPPVQQGYPQQPYYQPAAYGQYPPPRRNRWGTGGGGLGGGAGMGLGAGLLGGFLLGDLVGQASNDHYGDYGGGDYGGGDYGGGDFGGGDFGGGDW